MDNSGSSTNYEDSVVDVETEAYVTSIDSITEGEQYVVRFTAYNNGVSIWNRDVTYTMRTAIMVYIFIQLLFVDILIQQKSNIGALYLSLLIRIIYSISCVNTYLF